MIQVAIVDDHQLFRKSLCLLIDSFEGVKSIFDACNGKDFFEKLSLSESVPDIVLLDIEMPEMNGFEVCALLRVNYPDIKVLIVSQLTTKESIHKTMELGAHGYFTKNSDPGQLQLAIKSLQEIGYYFGMELGTVIREALLWQKKASPSSNSKKKKYKSEEEKEKLSSREVEILKMACKEYNTSEIAEKLCITVKTVESHRKHILEKTSAKNFIGAIIFALKHEYFTYAQL
ncbi:MAG: hypothetical protein CFE23_05535 [Flavobacterium sp. BFFFF1]|uniref:response regulator transcription factor n=1 Tax=unclassified Flavobacterium TaxID=196869 RepID=UPI000BC6B033|nr:MULTISPECIES: response regulator transcription factor [unclassified Flavobacterium]OYU81227.1 MAG: hypothetical protein CFE23_05535 [Flavobacterium sp. BFFFF1]